MKCAKEELLLYAVTDRSWLGESTLYQQVRDALEGGATFIQLRERNWRRRHFWRKPERSKLCVKSIRFLLSSMTV